MRRLAALIASWALACGPVAVSPGYSDVRVALVDSADGAWGWRPAEREAVAARLAALGPAWYFVGAADADVRLRAARGLPAGACARRSDVADEIEVDTSCARDALGRDVAEALAHWAWSR